MFHRRTLIASLAATALFFTSPASGQQVMTENLEITGGFARETAPMAKVGAAFMTIRSLGAADRLVGYTTPACNRPELHTHIETDGVMQMRQVEAIEVPAGGETKLEPGGLHLMMIDLNQQLVAGETVSITLLFEQAGEVPIEVPVMAMSAMGAMDDMDATDHSDDMGDMDEMDQDGQ